MNGIFISGRELENTLSIASKTESYKFSGIQFDCSGSVKIFDTSKDLSSIHSAVRMQKELWKAMTQNPDRDFSLLFWD